MNFIISLALSEFVVARLALVSCSCTICVQLQRVFRGNVLFHYLFLSAFICFFLFFLFSIICFFLFVFVFCRLFVYLICNLFIDFLSTNNVFLCVVFGAGWIGVCRLKHRFE